MTGLRIGELFAGYGGLGMGTQAFFGGELAWYSEIDKGALKILTHRFRDVPNIGDITTVDWSQVEPVDILTGGSPCQDLSHAGKRAGMTEGTRSNLWVAMREAIAQLRPSIVIWENVRGANSAEADSDLADNPRLLDGVRRRDGQPLLRALGRVLGDLSELGYVGGWHGLRAADAGAPHGRFRYFVVAYPASNQGWVGDRDGGIAADASGLRRLPGWTITPRQADSGWAPSSPGGCGPVHPGLTAMLPTPTARDWKGAGPSDASRHSPNLSAVEHLLPTPAVNDMGAGKTVDDWDAWTDRMKAEHGNGNGHGKSRAIEAQRLLPTPSAAASSGHSGVEWKGDALYRPDGTKISSHTSTTIQHLADHPSTTETNIWGDYAPAIARWEQILGRPAPAPTQTSAKGNPQLSAAFVEWLMGLPAGWVTDVPGITRNEALKALGNGVVPQQAEAAIRFLVAQMAVAA